MFVRQSDVTKRWPLRLAAATAFVASLVACPNTDNTCGSPDACEASISDSGNDGGAQCPSGKEPKDDPSCVDEKLGIFVAPSPAGNDSNAGTKSAPVATLKTALQKVGTKSFIFVCEGSYAESVDIKQSAAVFGGFKCSDWSYSATTLPKFTGTKPDYVFHLDGANDTIIGDLELDAMDGAVGTGQSSVGMFVVNSQSVKVERMTIHAGKGADGASGALAAFTFPSQTNGADADGGFGGGTATANCPGGMSSTGGAGGDIALDGKDGTPALGGGLHGDAGTGGVNPPCTAGGNGANAGSGTNGLGANSFGDLTDGGWAPASGDDGGVGGPGQGGGGGGGQVSGGNSGGGGGGGAGACGGAGGGGGHGGGASVALATLNSTLEVSNTTCACGNAGAGGSGVAGQAGSTAPGAHGNGHLFGCIGGNGGNGGDGGGGGGGSGGISVGIVSKGGSVTIDAFTQSHLTTGTPGKKGSGAAGNDGIAGISDASLML